jgi:predicted HD phosphohydrolase
MMGTIRHYKAAVTVTRTSGCLPQSQPIPWQSFITQTEVTPMTDPRLQRIAGLLTLKAGGQYGLSDINQRQHALQAAWLAERLGCPEPLIAASLLHDIGHLVHELGDNPAEAGVDDRHEERGYEFLKTCFGPDVTEPVRLHVAAKRYLCATEADYFSTLSKDSVLSLSLQGGPMSPAEVAAFEPTRCDFADSTSRPRSTDWKRHRWTISCPVWLGAFCQCNG